MLAVPTTRGSPPASERYTAATGKLSPRSANVALPLDERVADEVLYRIGRCS